MKKIALMSLYGLLIFGFCMSFVAAGHEQETSESLQKRQASEIKELTIRNSGFLSKSDIVIRYRADDKTIVSVIENGKMLPESEFARYESLVREVLEIPQIDRLLPEIERAKRIAESGRISEEAKIREMLELRKRLETLDSERARRYRDINELFLMEEIKAMTDRISSSRELSQEQKIQQLKDVLEKIRAMDVAKEVEERRRMMAELSASNAARKLIQEIEKSEAMTREEKVKEIQELLSKMQAERLIDAKRTTNVIEFQAADAMKRMLEEIAKMKDISEQERAKEFDRIIQEANKVRSENIDRMLGIEKFKFELHRLLKTEGLLPEGKAEFILKTDESTLDGKKLPKQIHEKVMKLCEEHIGKTFDRDSKIVLTLNEER